MASNEEVPCTALDQEWGDDRPNFLMHPPCACPRCEPEPLPAAETANWLLASGDQARRRVQTASLGDTGRSALG